MKLPCSDRGIFRFLAMAILDRSGSHLGRAALPGVSADGGEDGNRDDYSHDQAPPIPDKGRAELPQLRLPPQTATGYQAYEAGQADGTAGRRIGNTAGTFSGGVGGSHRPPVNG